MIDPTTEWEGEIVKTQSIFQFIKVYIIQVTTVLIENRSIKKTNFQKG